MSMEEPSHLSSIFKMPLNNKMETRSLSSEKIVLEKNWLIFSKREIALLSLGLLTTKQN